MPYMLITMVEYRNLGRLSTFYVNERIVFLFQVLLAATLTYGFLEVTISPLYTRYGHATSIAKLRPNGRCHSCFRWKFQTMISPRIDLCLVQNQNQTINLLILVLTQHKNNYHRSLFREFYNATQWEPDSVRLLFALGNHPSSSKTLEHELKSEAISHGDILQVAVNATYRNMTRILYSSLDWVLGHCANAKFVLKITDDVILNVPGILYLINTIGDTELSHVVSGNCADRFPDIKETNKGDKWYLSPYDYPYRQFPAYCSGAGMLIPLKLFKDHLSKEAENMAFIPHVFDDVTMGINLRLTNHCVCDVPGFSFFDYVGPLWAERAKNSVNGCEGFRNDTFLGAHMHGVPLGEMRQFWSKRHCYERLVDTNLISRHRCRRRGQCPQDFYPVRDL